MALAHATDDDLTSFGTLLRSYRVRAGRSRSGLAREVGVDPSYCTRAENGDRDPPRRHIVAALAVGLRLPPFERNRLLVSAGYAAEPLAEHGWTAVHQAVSDVMEDWDLSEQDRVEFADLVQTIAKRYRPESPRRVR